MYEAFTLPSIVSKPKPWVPPYPIEIFAGKKSPISVQEISIFDYKPDGTEVPHLNATYADSRLLKMTNYKHLGILNELTGGEQMSDFYGYSNISWFLVDINHATLTELPFSDEKVMAYDLYIFKAPNISEAKRISAHMNTSIFSYNSRREFGLAVWAEENWKILKLKEKLYVKVTPIETTFTQISPNVSFALDVKGLYSQFREYGRNLQGKYLYDYVTAFRPIGIDIFAEGVACELKDNSGFCDVFKPAALSESGIVVAYINHGYTYVASPEIVTIYKQYEAAFIKTNKMPTLTEEESKKLLERDKKIIKV